MLHQHVSGSGPAHVFLHGWGMHSGVWQALIEPLTATKHVALLDLPGHGHSAMCADYSLENLAHAVEQSLPTTPVTLVGWSLGGMVALMLALTSPARVRQLILVGTSPQFVADNHWPHAMSAATLCAFAEQLRENHRATLERFLALQVMGCPDGRRTLTQLKAALSAAPTPDPQALTQGLAILRERSLLSQLGDVHVPVTIIHGERDTLVPLAGAKAMAARLQNARLHILRGAGHAPFISHAEQFRSLLEAGFDD
ncbi:MAG: pimeloyl-ACP methyl ester esterase BioH [Chromatiales bacterium]|jgi:pimeloyl-[acyl-carrier protein] methyl ester esterase|nr:pimeloyl-ACP methyl ester esterase BioH [Chromatiales bacterium]